MTNYDVTSIFPFWKLICFDKDRFNHLSKNCFTGLHDFWKIGEVLDEELCPDQFEDIYTTYGYDQLTYKMSKYVRSTSELQDFKNPGVQTNIVYSSVMKTPVRVYLDHSPLSSTLQNKRYPIRSEERRVGKEC